METFVIVRQKDLEEKVSDLLKKMLRTALGETRPSSELLLELQALEWSFCSFLDSKFCKLTPRNFRLELAFNIIRTLGLTPKLDKEAGKWYYVFPKDMTPHEPYTILGMGNTVDEAAERFYQSMEFGCGNAVDILKEEKAQSNDK